MNDKMRKASQLVIGGAIALSLVTGCAKMPDSTPAISQPAVTEPSAMTKATKPTATKPTAPTKATTAPSESKATTPSATTLPPETKPAATTAPTQAPTTAPTAAPTTAPTEAPTTAPTEAPTTAPTEAPTEATTAPTEAPQISLDYNEAMAAGNAYGVSAYGWIYDPNLGWDDGFEFPTWYPIEGIMAEGGQDFLNSYMEKAVRTSYQTFLEVDGEPLPYYFNCYCYESNGSVYFYVFYG